MKRIFSLILLILLAPFALVVTGCGDKGYQLSNAKNEILAIADKYDTIKMQDGKLVISYEEYITHEEYNIVNVINTIKPFSYLNDFNNVYNNLMDFSYTYLDECCNDNIKVDKELRNRLQTELTSLDSDMMIIDINTKEWINTVQISTENISFSVICISRYNDLLDSYADLYETASNINEIMSTIYFEHALNDANKNYYDMDILSFDAGMVINKLDARLKYQKANLTSAFVEMYLDNPNMVDDLTDVDKSFGSLNLDQNSYISKVNAISKTYNAEASILVANRNKEAFYEAAVELYNIQKVLSDSEDMYYSARKAIVYTETVVKENPTVEERINLEIIGNYHNLISQYNNTLNKLLTLMGV